jgi:DNA-binding transcriptional ArsR family regulator
MAAKENQPLDRVFRALSDPTRRALLTVLARGERTVGELAAPFDMSLAAVSKHLRLLQDAGLLTRRVEGRTHYCRLDPDGFTQARRWLLLYERLRSGDFERRPSW